MVFIQFSHHQKKTRKVSADGSNRHLPTIAFGTNPNLSNHDPKRHQKFYPVRQVL
ncbi:hypothetical protein EVA_14026 [gut metagenome]|uniref:Uncharacterized protein n=1 Tax=gut metagenome TaxID=749906 RepID=J9FTN7_9ZZZZ